MPTVLVTLVLHGSMIEGSSLLLGLVAVGFLVTTIFELLSPLALLDSRFRAIWAVYIVGPPQHVGRDEHRFQENLVLIVVVFTHVLRPRRERASIRAAVAP